MTEEQQLAGAKFVAWLERQVVADARGDDLATLQTKPGDRLWLGRLAPESAAWKAGMGERGQRLDPCSAGFRFRPSPKPPWGWTAHVGFCIWTREGEKDARHWKKSERMEVSVPIGIASDAPATYELGKDEFAALFAAAGHDDTPPASTSTSVTTPTAGFLWRQSS